MKPMIDPIKFREGTEITCPRCGHVQGVANRDICSGGLVASSDWDGILTGTLMTCCVEECLGYYGQHSGGRLMIHTSEGWG
jgi:hypothetical protein